MSSQFSKLKNAVSLCQRSMFGLCATAWQSSENQCLHGFCHNRGARFDRRRSKSGTGFFTNIRSLSLFFVVSLTIGSNVLGADGVVEALEETAFKQAAALADPSVVRIETVGGLEQVDEVLLGAGPTSGVVVSSDGYIISSSFNFVGKPASILVTLPDGRRFAAKQVANDRLRLLTLLHVEVDGLIPAKPAPMKETRVGQWALALGRTLDNSTPSLSVGIVSALNRVWGKAIQTDAKTSPVNYGGALIDIEGRVLGVIAPLSPMGSGDMAGVEWYDGGIGFAIPMEDVYSSLDRLKQGTDLLPGLMGITFVGGQQLNVPAIIDRVRYNSPAHQAGLKTNDRVIEADDEKIVRIAQLKQIVGRKYAGDSLKLVVSRGDSSVPLEVALVGELIPYEIPFLGILPQRKVVSPDSPEIGTSARLVFPNSPAEQAGLLRGDRIVKFNDVELNNSRVLTDLVGRSRPGDRAKITYVRDGQPATAEATLGSLPEQVVDELSVELIEPVIPKEPEGTQQAEEKAEKKSDDKIKTGRFTATIEGSDHDYWAYVPETYTDTHTYGLVVWIHPNGDPMEAAVLKQWKSVCDRRGLILVAPKADKPSGWQPGEAEFIKQLIGHIRAKYTIDANRIVLHSYGTGAGITSLVSTKHRDLVRGVVIAGAPFLTRPTDNDPEFRQQFFFVCGDGDKLLSKVSAAVDALRKLKFPVSFTAIKGFGAKYPEEIVVEEIARWVDCLDRI
jgi:serine protease Do